MKDIPIPFWVPAIFVALFVYVIWRSPLADGELVWHVVAAIGVYAYASFQNVGRGAVRLLAAMALWFGADITLAYFIMLWSITGVAAWWLCRLAKQTHEDTFPILPFAMLAFAVTIVHAPIWSHVVGPAPVARADTSPAAVRVGQLPSR